MRRLALLIPAAILLVLVIAQLVLPGIATRRLRDRLARSGSGLSVEVHAFPAIELLWHHADRVVVHVAQYHSSTGHLGSLLAETADVGELDASAGELDAGLLTLRDATLRKRGNQLTGRARISEDDLRRSIPVLESVQPVASGGGQLVLRGTASLLGVSATVDATVGASDGKLVVTPDVPFGALATIAVFSDPHVEVQGVSASSVAGGFVASAQAHLH